jgi:hypothetical protein
MPIRGTIAIIATVIAIALMAGFKTPEITNTHPSGQPVAIGSPPSPADSPGGDGATAVPAPSATSTPSASGSKDGSYDGGDYPNEFGDVQVRVVVKNGKISDVQALRRNLHQRELCGVGPVIARRRMPDGEQLKPRAPRTIRVEHVMGTVVGIDVRVPGPREVHYLAGAPHPGVGTAVGQPVTFIPDV